MRRTAAVVFSVALTCLGLAACGEGDDRPSAEGGTGQTWQDPVPAGTGVEIAGLEILVDETEVEHGEEGAGKCTREEPGEGQAHVSTRVTATPAAGGSPGSDDVASVLDSLELRVLGSDGVARRTEMTGAATWADRIADGDTAVLRLTARVPAGTATGVRQARPGFDADDDVPGPRYLASDAERTGVVLTDLPPGDGTIGHDPGEAAGVDEVAAASSWVISVGSTDIEDRAAIEEATESACVALDPADVEGSVWVVEAGNGRYFAAA